MDRAVSAGEVPLRERTIEAQANSEETVIPERAHVTKEVVITKDSVTCREAVTDKVRRTEVEDENGCGRMQKRKARRS